MRLVPTAALTLGLLVPGLVVTSGAAEAAAASCGGLRATIVGNARANTLEGTDRRDVIAAGDGDDTIRGLGGNDVICGGGGADRIFGGADDDAIFGGTDRYHADAFGLLHKEGDLIDPGAGNDTVDPGYDARRTSPGVDFTPDSVTYADARAAAVVDLRTSPATVGAHGADTITVAAGSALRFVGTAYNDVIRGTYQDDVLIGLGGDDQIFGQDGDDRILPDGADSAGADLVDGGGGRDIIESVAGYDTLIGGIDADAISSTSVNRLSVNGGSGGDTITVQVPGETGFRVLGGPGQDKLRMQAYPNPAVEPTLRMDQRKGVTTVTHLAPVAITGKVQSFTEVVLPGNTRSFYKGLDKGEIIDANPEHRAVIKGRGGADVITGSHRADLLVGGKGFDIAFAKAGNDRCLRIERRGSC
ncbi:calcium-binding protein [Nocardioides sp. P5_C9_2]